MAQVYSKQYNIGPFWGAVFLVVIFGLSALACVIVGVALIGTGGEGAVWPLLGSGALFALIAAITAFFAVKIRRGVHRLPLQEVPNWGRLVAEVEQAFADTPYTVDRLEDGLRIHVDLADARFLTFGAARRVLSTFTVIVAPVGPDAVEQVEERVGLEWTAGANGEPRAHLGGESSRVSGTVHTATLHREFGFDRSGPGAKVDYGFTSSEVKKPLKAALAAAGFGIRRSPTTQLGLVMALLGGGVAVSVCLALVVLAFTGGFG